MYVTLEVTLDCALFYRMGRLSAFEAVYVLLHHSCHELCASGNITMNVRQPRDFGGDLRLEISVVQVYLACLVRVGVPRDTPEQHLLRNGAELFNQNLELCLKLGLQSIELPYKLWLLSL